MNETAKVKILRKPEVLSTVGLSYTTVWRLERAGHFPRRRQLGGRAVGWLENEIREWIASRGVVNA
jgi:prophage regulatory protein